MGTNVPSVDAGNIMKDNSPVVCYRKSLITSAGVWLGDHPLSFALPLLMAQTSVIIASTKLSHSILRRLGQPRIVSEIVAGLILGVSGAGRNQDFLHTLFPQKSRIQIDLIAQVGLMLFLFMIGVKTDLSMIRNSGRKASSIAISCTLLPFGIMSLVGYLLRHSMPPDFRSKRLIFELAGTWARTSYTVVSCILYELNLLNSKMGRLAMSATLIADFITTVLSAIERAVDLVRHASNEMLGFGSFVSFLGLFAFILLVARPATQWIIRRTPEGEHLDEIYFLLILWMAFACGFIGELVGQHSTMGTFLLGLFLPGGPPLGTTLQNRLEAILSGMLIPLFIASAGFRSDFSQITDGKRCGYAFLFIVIGAVGKVAGVVAPCWYCKVPMRDTVVLALMMISKGIFEVYVLNIWLDTGMVDQQLYAVIVLCVLAISAVTTPLIKALCKPSMRYIVHKRRTIQHARRDAELRLLACIHGQEHVAPMVEVLKASHATKESPICIYVLHLVQLVGQAAAVLGPYEKHRHKASVTTSDTDHIVNAFRSLEEANSGSILVQPFVSISPHTTMHDDVCTVALDKKVSCVILPFHKHRTIDGTMEATSALKALNVNVLNYAPCSVGIFVDHGPASTSQFIPAKSLIHHVAVYFIGGPDDREALAYAMRMGLNPTIAVTVFRFRPPWEWRVLGPEEEQDDELVAEFQMRADDKRMVYREEEVKDGEETIEVIRATSHYFSLLVVGRRKGMESLLTEGLSMWSEYPELGVLGNMLASTDFGSNVSTLIVQQQARVGADYRDGMLSCSAGGWCGRFSWKQRVVPLEIADGVSSAAPKKPSPVPLSKLENHQQII